MIPDSSAVTYNDQIPLEPRVGQDGIVINATPVASVPVVLPGEPGDIASIVNEGPYDIKFLFVSTILGRATGASETVFAEDKELFLVPAIPCFLSVIGVGGSSTVVVNCFRRGS